MIDARSADALATARHPKAGYRLLHGLCRLFTGIGPQRPPGDPKTVLVLQPNHIGDLLMTTALLAVLRRSRPPLRITVACGPWNVETLANNPDVDEVFPIEPPWDNSFVAQRGTLAALRYILWSPAARELASRRFDLGIDTIGGRLNGLMLARLGVGRIIGGPFGYRPRSRSAGAIALPAHEIASRLSSARWFGVDDMPEPRPRLFLSESERRRAEELWNLVPGAGNTRRHRIVVAPAGSFPYKRWPAESFAEVVRWLAARGDVALAVVGGADTVDTGRMLESCGTPILNLAGRASLRETFALTAAADLVFGNSNMVWHVGAAFDVPAVIVLPAAYDSADDHAATWGYPSSIVLGRRPSHPEVYTPAEVIAVLAETLDLARRKPDNP